MAEVETALHSRANTTRQSFHEAISMNLNFEKGVFFVVVVMMTFATPTFSEFLSTPSVVINPRALQYTIELRVSKRPFR